MDVGANIGFLTLLSAVLTGPTGRVLAFEPFGESFALLERNIALNGVTNVVARRLAIGGVAGVILALIVGWAINSADIAYMPPTASLQAGVMCAAPDGRGFAVQFEGLVSSPLPGKE